MKRERQNYRSREKKGEQAVSEVLGEVLLLVIVVALATVLSASMGNLMPDLKDVPYASFIGRINGNNYTIVHEGGDSIDLTDLKIIIDNGSTITSLGVSQIQSILNDENGNGYWDFGERLNISRTYGSKVTVTIAVEKQVLCRLFFE